MAVTLQFEQPGLLMPHQFHHPSQIGILFVAPQHFQFPVAGDQKERRRICPHVPQRRQRINLWLRVFNIALVTDRKMGNGLTAQRNQFRNAVGIFDASTLGKIEVVGPDAAEFLNRMYTNPWKALEPGRCRYGLLLREDGFITDDGVSARLAPDRFHLTTTTGGAARVLNMMEDYLQTEFPELKVSLTSTTEQWAVIAVQGPKARDVIAPLCEGIDLSKEAARELGMVGSGIAKVRVEVLSAVEPIGRWGQNALRKFAAQ